MKPKFAKAYMKIAHTFADLSYAKKLKVGAIVVKDARIISTGYNGMPSGWDNDCEKSVIEEGDYDPKLYYKTNDEVLHAESNALMKVAASNDSSFGATMFCTHTPCIECAKLIIQSGIKSIYIDYHYNAAKGCGLRFLQQSDIRIIFMKDVDQPLSFHSEAV